MMNRLLSKYFPLLLLLAVVFAATGCSNHVGPLEPTAELSTLDTGDPIASPNFVVINKAAKDSPRIRMVTTIEQFVSAADGGVVTNGRVSLYFPPGALQMDTSIRIDMDPTGLLISDMSPHGIQFMQDVVLTMGLAGTSAEDEAEDTFLAWFNDVTGVWEMIDNMPPPDDDTIQGRIQHFSQYSGVGG